MLRTCLPACGVIGRWRNVYELVPSGKIQIIEDMSTEGDSKLFDLGCDMNSFLCLVCKRNKGWNIQKKKTNHLLNWLFQVFCYNNKSLLIQRPNSISVLEVWCLLLVILGNGTYFLMCLEPPPFVFYFLKVSYSNLLLFCMYSKHVCGCI